MQRKINAENTRASILDVSEKLFLEKGFEKTTTQEIVNLTGIAKGTLFHHFPTKEAILSAVLEKYNDSTILEMRKWLEGMDHLTACEKLSLLFNRFYDLAETTPLSKMALTSRSPRLILEDLQIWAKKIAPIMLELMEEGLADGSIQTEYPDECGQLFNLLFCIWCDPVTLACDAKQLLKRLEFIQHAMRALGADIVSEEFIAKSLTFAEDLY